VLDESSSIRSNSPRISVLSAAMADQIAAGEVVERPASVVKELIENAVDAGATRIEVELEAGGKGLIRVADNGCGMHREDLVLAVTRHATSKIREAQDLIEIATLGFRGEALASLAAVSNLRLKSRPAKESVGHELRMTPGTTPELGPVGMAHGTIVEARMLFSNVPARLKFLRQEATEVGHCVDAVLRTALVHPEIHFRVTHDRRELVELPKTSIEGRVRQVLARRGDADLVGFDDVYESVRVRGWLAAACTPARPNATLYIVVRRRVVRDRNIGSVLRKAMASEAYGEQPPSGVIWIDPPNGEVDVNVHPQKNEVRFADATKVYAAVREVVSRLSFTDSNRAVPRAAATSTPTSMADIRAAVERTHLRPQAEQVREEPRSRFHGGGAPHRGENVPVASPSQTRSTPEVGTATSAAGNRYRLATQAASESYETYKQERKSEVAALREKNERSAAPPAEDAGKFTALGQALLAGVDQGRLGNVERSDNSPWTEASTRREPNKAPALPETPRPAGNEESGRAPEVGELLTLLAGPTALFQVKGELWVVDLRRLRAHLVLMRLQRELRTKGAVSQQVLVPSVVAASAADVALVREHGSALRRLGLEVEPFADDALVLRGVPVELCEHEGKYDPSALMHRVLPWLRLHAQKSETNGQEDDALSPALAMLAESSQVPAAPRLAKRWLAEIAASGELDSTPGIVRWTAEDLVRGRS
jgi:DNA mismatch repair protein MutL